jgi:outer membrane protein TolC
VFTDAGSRTTIVRTVPGGFGDALDQLFGFGFPIYQFGLNLRLPLRDRAASANLADALVNKRLTTLRARSLEQQIRQEVLNAVTQVESSKAAIKLAVVARDLAKQSLDAENKKYELGVTQIFFVLAAQQRLVNAEAQVAFQSTQYRRNLLNLLRQTGELLDERGIVIQ